MLLEGRVFSRIHRAEHDPLFFSTSGSGRFDLDPEGTLYLAETPVGALIEVFRGRLIPLDEVSLRQLAAVEVRGIRVADLTDTSCRGFGVTAEIHATPDYGICQRWARALYEAGFQGVRYRLRHDPSGGESGHALFGSELRTRLMLIEDAPISERVVEQVWLRFRILVLPTRQQR